MKIQPTRVIHRIDASNPHEGERRAEWPPGPWEDEPDLVEWRDAATGYPCLVVRGSLGALCGYVGVPPEHPWHGKEYGDSAVDVGAHGGLTYSNACAGNICHVPLPGESDAVWWFGFDCAHSGDVTPGMIAIRADLCGSSSLGESYRGLGYVQSEVTDLALQLQQARPGTLQTA